MFFPFACQRLPDKDRSCPPARDKQQGGIWACFHTTSGCDDGALLAGTQRHVTQTVRGPTNRETVLRARSCEQQTAAWFSKKVKCRQKLTVGNQYAGADVGRKDKGGWIIRLLIEPSSLQMHALRPPRREPILGLSVSGCFLYETSPWCYSRGNNGNREERQLAHRCLAEKNK